MARRRGEYATWGMFCLPPAGIIRAWTHLLDSGLP
jgi:hypothetical protein